MNLRVYVNTTFTGPLSDLRQLLTTVILLTMMKNAFLFHVKSSFHSQSTYSFILTFWLCKATA